MKAWAIVNKENGIPAYGMGDKTSYLEIWSTRRGAREWLITEGYDKKKYTVTKVDIQLVQKGT